jgi:hypothetical protein
MHMIQWLEQNMGTILVSLLLLLVVCLIIRRLWKDRKQGKSSCGGQCGSCPMHQACHKQG